MLSISVIIPVFNREAYLLEALQSVFHQTRPAHEILVIDDGSTDRSAEVARSFGPRVHCISQSNQGAAAARNAGLARARGDLIACLDSDDLWLENKLEIQARFLEDHPATDMVFCYMKPFLSPECDPKTLPPFDDRELEGRNCSCFLARRRVFERIGGFDAGARMAEFVSWFDRAEEKGLAFDCVPDLLLKRRIHLNNSVRNAAVRSGYLHALKRRLDRRRAAANLEN